MSRLGTKDISPETLEKIWELHTSGVKTTLIADVLGIHNASVSRFIRLMNMAKDGEDFEAVGGTNHKKQKAFIKKFWGITDKPVEELIEEQTEHQGGCDQTEDNFKEFAVRVLFELSHLNKLLEGLCKELGVKGDE